MLRSLLSCPANRPDELAAACRTQADGICLDLEDAVPAGHKRIARAAASEFLRSKPAAIPTWVRVNGPRTGLCPDDIAAIIGPRLAGIQVPKVENAADVREVNDMLADQERTAGLRPCAVAVIATLESATGLLNAYAIASAAKRVIALMPAIGAGGDLQNELGYTTTADDLGMLYARSRVVLAARAAGVLALDGSHVDVDVDSFKRSATAARTLGYRGKKIFHRAHIDAANSIFAQ